MAGWKVLTPAAALHVTVAELKAATRIDHSLEDGLLQVYLQAATTYAENVLRRALVHQVLELYLDAWPASRVFRLPRPPCAALTSVTYQRPEDAVGVYGGTADLALFLLDRLEEPAIVTAAQGASWPELKRVPNAVKVTLQAGYGAQGSAVPETTRQAIRMLAAYYAGQRAAVVEGQVQVPAPFGVLNLLWQDRVLYQDLAG